MSYFKQFPYLLYPNFSDKTGNTFSLLKDITVRVIRKISPTDEQSLYYKYNIKEGENIESISNDVYDSPNFYWVIMMINDKFDRFYDFPLNTEEFQNYIVDTYGSVAAAQTTYKYYIREAYERFSTNIGNTEETQINGATGILSIDPVGSQYEDNTFFLEVPQIDYDFSNPDSQIPRPYTQNGRVMKKAKSIYDYEFELNESKRNILLLNKQYLQSLVDTFNFLVK